MAGQQPRHPGEISLDAYRQAFANSPLGLSIVTRDRRFVFANPALQRMVNYDFAQLRGMRVDDVAPDVQRGQPNPLHEDLFREHIENFVLERRTITSDGREIWLNISGALLRDKENRPRYLIAQQSDVTAQRQPGRQMYWTAYHDGLTGLDSRQVFEDRLSQALLRAQRDHYGLVGVLHIGIDEFQHINDVYGHETGDQVLIEVARRLSFSVRDSDSVCRLGEEFAVLLDPIMQLDQAELIAERLRAIIARPIDCTGPTQMPARITASIGSAATHGASATADELLGNADKALYAAKSRGRNSTSTISDNGTEHLATVLDLASHRARRSNEN